MILQQGQHYGSGNVFSQLRVQRHTKFCLPEDETIPPVDHYSQSGGTTLVPLPTNPLFSCAVMSGIKQRFVNRTKPRVFVETFSLKTDSVRKLEYSGVIDEFSVWRQS